MKWNKITLEIREEVEDIVISTLRTSGLKVQNSGQTAVIRTG